MEAIILAGGLGTRLKERVSHVPKPMAEVCGKPFLSFILESLSKNGFNHVIISVGYMSDCIINFFGKKFLNLRIDYVIENSPLGTGGGIKLALTKSENDSLFIINGDTFVEVNFKKMMSLHLHHKKPIMLGVEMENVDRYGNIYAFKDIVKKIINNNENKKKGIINAGYYLFNSDFLNDLNLKSFSFENDFLKQFIKKNELFLYKTQGRFIDIGIPKDYDLAQLFFKTF